MGEVPLYYTLGFEGKFDQEFGQNVGEYDV